MHESHEEALEHEVTKKLAIHIYWWESGQESSNAPLSYDQLVEASANHMQSDPIFHRRVRLLTQAIMMDVKKVGGGLRNDS